MKRCNEHRDDWLMMLIVVPCAVLAAVILWIGAKDIERIQREQEPTYNVDSIRLIHQQQHVLSKLNERRNYLRKELIKWYRENKKD